MRINDLRLFERRVDRMIELDQWHSDPTIYVSFTELPKIGINPSSKFDTPIGIYAYPLKEMYRAIENDTIPYGGDAPYIQVLQSDLVTELSTYTQQNLATDVANLKKRFAQSVRLSVKAEGDLLDQMGDDGLLDTLHDRLSYSEYTKQKYENSKKLTTLVSAMNQDGRTFDHMVRQWAKEAEPSKAPPCQMWNITRNIALQISHGRNVGPLAPKPHAVAWNVILRGLGYQAFSDKHGIGLIHRNEPISAVFLSKQAFRHLRTVTNIRKYAAPLKLHSIEQMTEILASYSVAPQTKRQRNLLLKEWPTLLDGESEHFQYVPSSAASSDAFAPFMQQVLRLDFNQLPIVAKELRHHEFFKSAVVIHAFVNIQPSYQELSRYLEVMLGETSTAYEAAYTLADVAGIDQHIANRQIGEAILSHVSHLLRSKDDMTTMQRMHLEILLHDTRQPILLPE